MCFSLQERKRKLIVSAGCVGEGLCPLTSGEATFHGVHQVGISLDLSIMPSHGEDRLGPWAWLTGTRGLLIQLRLSCRTFHLSFAPASPLARHCPPRLSVLIPKEYGSLRLSPGRVGQEDRGVSVAGVTWSQVPSLHSQIPRGAGPCASASAHLGGVIWRGAGGVPRVLVRPGCGHGGGGHSTSIQMA